MLRAHENDALRLIMISNRGTQVWPEASVFTECVDQYRARYELNDGFELRIPELLAFAQAVSADFAVASVEMLRYIGGKPGYSLAQGQ